MSARAGWFVAAICGALVSIAAADGPADRMPQYRLLAEGFGDDEDDIRAVCDSAGSQLWRHAGGHPTEPFVVRRGRQGPFFSHEANDRGELAILLDTGDSAWSQYAYQFAHEFCHLLCGRRNKPRKHLWFEETLAETASLFALRGMAREWKTNPPYRNWRDYRDSLRDYADRVERRRARIGEIHAQGLAAFYRTHRETLESNPTDRELNGAMALVLLREFENEPDGWESVRWLNATPPESRETFAAHLAAWRDGVPEKRRPFVERIAALYGVQLPVRAAP